MRIHAMTTRSMKRCENTKAFDIYPRGQCIGGRAFRIKDKWFCGPQCGNQYWELKRGDKHYWPDDDESSLTDWSAHDSEPSESEPE